MLHFALRLLTSSSMVLDESEQFLLGAAFSPGSESQPPLYSWLVHIVSLFSGMSLTTVLAVKYAVMFSFYGCFYLVARTLWGSRESLIVTGSLMLLPTYSYEFNRDLSHSILVSAVASMTCLVFIRVLLRGRPADYLFLGLSSGLGVLAKYNFAFFLLAMALAGISTGQGRRAVFDRKTCLSAAGFALAVLPHFLWLAGTGFHPVAYALEKAGTGGLALLSPAGALSLVLSAYSEVLIFGAVFLVFFAGHLSRGGAQSPPVSGFLRRLAFFGLVVPLVTILFLKTGQFRGRWLAPVLFPLALALFSFVDFRGRGRRFKYYAGVCVVVAMGVFFSRALIGFFPDAAGKVERVHIPCDKISSQLARELASRGIPDARAVYIVSNSQHLAANLMARLPFKNYLLLRNEEEAEGALNVEEARQTGGVVVWEERGVEDIPGYFLSAFPGLEPAGTLEAPYLHSRGFPPYALRAAIIPAAGGPGSK
jgi:4-amino-4-deoxy-L-arabinose transferase-like glycosyltransferase